MGGELKIIELEEELRVVATNLKSLEVSEDKANKREASYKEQIKTLTAKLKQAEPELSLLRDPSRNSRKRLTDWRMNSLANRRNTKQSLRSWRPHLLSALDTKSLTDQNNIY